MGKSLFVMPIANDVCEPCFAKIKDALSAKFAKIAVLSPIKNDINDAITLFSREEALEILGRNPAEFHKRILNEFDKLDSENDCVIVVGAFLNHELSLQIAKNLNLPIIQNTLDKFFIDMAQNAGLTVLPSLREFDAAKFLPAFENATSQITTPLKFEHELYKKARANKKCVVLPEGFDERILRAGDIILKSGAVDLIILGDEEKIKNDAKNLGLDLGKAKFINPENNEYLGKFADTLFELRQAKGMTKEKASELVKDKSYFGTMLVYSGIADAMVSGASTTTAETIRPALQIIKMKPGVSTVSGAFFMCMDSKVWVFADCAITPNPTPEQLAGIAKSSADSARAFGISPRVAMLSYSTGNSGSGESVEATIKATALAKEMNEFEIDGPLQFDAAVNSAVAKKKLPDSKVAGKANVFIFPDLNCGNIAYKAVQRSANAVAIGPILQGLKKPVNDLSRGCLVEDVVNTILISAIQAGV